MGDNDERRRDCTTCISHLQYESEIKNLKHTVILMDKHQAECWEDVKKRVPFSVFTWAFGLLVTVMLIISTIQYNKMEKVLDNTYSIKVEMAGMKAELTGVKNTINQIQQDQFQSREEREFIRQRLFGNAIENNEIP